MGKSSYSGMEYKPSPIVLLQINRDMDDKLLGYSKNSKGTIRTSKWALATGQLHDPATFCKPGHFSCHSA